MSKRRTKWLRRQLIEILGTAPSPRQWMAFKRAWRQMKRIVWFGPETERAEPQPVAPVVPFVPIVPTETKVPADRILAEKKRSLWVRLLIWLGIRRQ